MKKRYTQISVVAILALITLTLSFAGWRAQAARGVGRNAAAAPVKGVFATITVNSTADGSLAALAGNGMCDLREAITAANTNAAVDACPAGAAGADVIQFALGAGTPTINLLSDLPGITDPVTINGNTGGSTRVELNGTALPSSAGLVITAGNSTIAGLVINRFGGAGILIQTNGGNTIRNCYLGTDATGTMDLGNGQFGLHITSANNTIGGPNTGMPAADRNVISGNDLQGIFIVDAGNGNRVIGNYIGIDATGTVALRNGLNGIFVNTANNIIGGTTVGERNVISANVTRGVWLNGAAATGNQVLGNYIGTDATGTANLGNGVSGVQTDNGASNNLVGGTNPAASNLIANNSYGVIINSANDTGNVILGNSIFNNQSKGIGLTGSNSSIPNDAGDADTGPNNLQNYPVLTCMTNVGGVTTINGTFNSLATTSFRIEYFLNDACDNATSNGEGQAFIGAQTVTTDASGNAPLTLSVLPPIAVGKVITATATLLNAMGNPVETSEFSRCLAITAPPTLSIGDRTVAEGNAGTANMVFTVTLAGAQNWCSPVTVNYATADGTAPNGATAGSDYTATSGTLIFDPPHASNSVTQTITVPIIGDTAPEPSETFFVNLSGATNATFTKSQALAAIRDDDFVRASLTDPLSCTGPGNTVTGLIQVTNPNQTLQGFTLTTTFSNLVGLPGTCVVTGVLTGTASCTVTATGLTASGTIPLGGGTGSIQYQAQVIDGATGTAGASSSATIASVTATFDYSTPINCPAGVGAPYPANSAVSDQKPGSVLFYNLFTSDATNGAAQNTRITLTNTHALRSVAVHMFFVDGSSCSVADSYICLTANQTASILASDVDPGTTGYIVAVATDSRGCPINFNYLIGDEYVKFASGHASNLGAEAFSSLAGGLPTCDGNSVTATLNFDGVSYNRTPAVLALSNLGSKADGNDTLLILNRIGGNLGTGAATLGSLFGILYDDAENALSFSVAENCQLRSSISNNFPRTTPRFETFIPAGRTGWLKVFNQTGAAGILGAAINFNPNAASSAGAFNQGHNLHALTLSSAASYVLPVFPPGC